MNNNGNSILKKINILGSKANELITENKLITNDISNYQKLFSSNKNYITLYFNILAEKKKESKKNTKNNKNTNDTNTNNNHINKIKDIIIKNHSEIKEENNLLKQKLKSIKQKNKSYLNKLYSEINNLSEYYDKISEDNFLYDNAIISKENLIKCLQKDLIYLKKNLYEEKKHIYLKYNFQNIYKPANQTQSNTNNKNNKNDSLSFEEGENEFKDLLIKERQQYIIRMKLRGEMRLKYRKMNAKKSALNDLVTSISFINKTEIMPSKSNNIFQILNTKIGGVIKNYEKFFNEDDEIIDENYFIFLPFELEINKDEINELVQTDITLPNKKLQSKSINEYKKKEKHLRNNKSFINVPKLNFLQIEFNKEKISYSDCESENTNNTKDKKNENDLNNKKENKNATNNNNAENNNISSNKNKNKNEDLNIKIKKIKKDIKHLKKKNHKMKRLINDFEKFQKKIEDKFIIFEKRMLNNKQENIDYLKEK